MRAALAFQTSRHLPGDEKVAQAILHRHLWVSAKFAVPEIIQKEETHQNPPASSQAILQNRMSLVTYRKRIVTAKPNQRLTT